MNKLVNHPFTNPTKSQQPKELFKRPAVGFLLGWQACETQSREGNSALGFFATSLVLGAVLTSPDRSGLGDKA
jgi:hypothetical protein